MSTIYSAISKINKSVSYYFTQYEDSIYLADSYYRYSDMIKYLIVDTETNAIYTNIESYLREYSNTEISYNNLNENTSLNSLEVIENEIKNSGDLYLSYDCTNKTVDTNINNIILQNLEQSYLKNILENNSSFKIYTAINNNPSLSNEFFIQQLLFNTSKNLGDIPIILVPFMIILSVIMGIYLLYALGHKKNVEGIYLNRFDKWPIEISGTIIFTLIVFTIVLVNETFGVGYNETASLILTIITISLLAIIYGLTMCLFATIIKKIKSHTLWNSSLVYRFCKWLKNIITTILNNLNINAKIIAIFLGVILISLLHTSMNILLLLIF